MIVHYDTNLAKHIGITAAVVYEHLRSLASEAPPKNGYPQYSCSIVELSEDLSVPLRTMTRTMAKLVDCGLLASKRSQYTMIWSVLANEEQAIEVVS
jgi:DNA-binding MarR family transcriptional regulator